MVSIAFGERHAHIQAIRITLWIKVNFLPPIRPQSFPTNHQVFWFYRTMRESTPINHLLIGWREKFGCSIVFETEYEVWIEVVATLNSEDRVIATGSAILC